MEQREAYASLAIPEREQRGEADGRDDLDILERAEVEEVAVARHHVAGLSRDGGLKHPIVVGFLRDGGRRAPFKR